MLRRVADGVLVHQSLLLQNNAVVVEGETGVLLIDPGLTDEEMTCLASDIRSLGRPVLAGFATHPDWDHVLWHAELGEVPRYGTARCAGFLRDLLSQPEWQAQYAGGCHLRSPTRFHWPCSASWRAYPPGMTHIPWNGPRVRVIEHPAHAPGHAALLIEQRGVLVAGDMLSDVLVPDARRRRADPIQDYLMGLRVLADVMDGVDVLVPGHGSVGTAEQLRERTEQDRAYVLALSAGLAPSDSRVESPRPGWEWVSDVHEGQLQRLAGGTAAT